MHCRLQLVYKSTALVTFEMKMNDIPEMHGTGWPQVWVKKIQGLFKDIQVRFQDLFQRRFTAMWAY